MKESILRNKSYAFAIKIVQLYKFIVKEHKEFVLSKQLLRSWTAIWALIHEAEFGQSTADFINKFSIALKEANESLYWLDLLKESWFIDNTTYIEIHEFCREILKMLISSINTLKKKQTVSC